MKDHHARVFARLCKGIVWTSCISALFAAAPSAWAQQTADASATTPETVVVSGSRLVTNGAEAPTPVTVVSADQLQLAAPTNLVDGLLQMPVFLGSTSVLKSKHRHHRQQRCGQSQSARLRRSAYPGSC